MRHTDIYVYLDFPLDSLVLGPPNLKIRAERIYTVESGLSQGDKKQYQIGFEGSALTSDTLITLHTDWTDSDGSSLPETLEGFTGRLAKVTGPNSLDGGAVNTFAINPGSRRQVVKLKGDILGTEHFYVHVFGTPEWEVLKGAGSGPLRNRPDHYVPIRVPIYDEATTVRLRNLNDYNRQDGRAYQDNVEAVYQWPYRPEMQFSVWEFAKQGLTRTGRDGTRTDLENGVQTIQITDQNVSLVYDLLAGKQNPLLTFGPAEVS